MFWTNMWRKKDCFYNNKDYEKILKNPLPYPSYANVWYGFYKSWI